MNRQPGVQTAALVAGAIFLAAGVFGFLPFAHVNGTLLGVVKADAIHNLLHIVIGLAGLAAAASVSNSRSFCQIVGAILIILGILAIFVASPIGFVNLGGSDIPLHLVGGAILAYFGFLAPVVIRR